MKKLILIALLASSQAFAINLQIGYPVNASRLSLTGDVNFTVNCKRKNIAFNGYANEIFKRHIIKNKYIMCYNDLGSYNVTVKFSDYGSFRGDMLQTQTNRYMINDVK